MSHLTIVLAMIVAALTLLIWKRIVLLPIPAVWRFWGTR
jgi:hypothetical protein